MCRDPDNDISASNLAWGPIFYDPSRNGQRKFPHEFFIQYGDRNKNSEEMIWGGPLAVDVIKKG